MIVLSKFKLVYKLYGLTEEKIAIVEGRGNEAKVKVRGEESGAAKPRRRGARGRSAVVGATALPDDDEELE